MRTFEQVRVKVCGSKVQHPGPGDARRALNRLRQPPTVYGIYRCPFADDGHWHVGHVPSMEALRVIADAIRGRLPTE